MPSVGELLIEKTREAEQRRILDLANECRDLDELKAKIRALLNSK